MNDNCYEEVFLIDKQKLCGLLAKFKQITYSCVLHYHSHKELINIINNALVEYIDN